MSTRVYRRDFLKTTLAAGAAVALPSVIPGSAMGKDGAVAASERLTIGVIACGLRSRVTKVYEQYEKSEVVAVCDPIKERRLKKLKTHHRNVKGLHSESQNHNRENVNSVVVDDLVPQPVVRHLAVLAVLSLQLLFAGSTDFSVSDRRGHLPAPIFLNIRLAPSHQYPPSNSKP